MAAFLNLGISDENIQVVVQLDEEQARHAYSQALVGRGFAESQADFYDLAIREGKTLVAVHNVIEAKPVIDIFDQYGSDFNPNGARNVRQDVFGLTAGAAAGVAAGTVIGGAVGAAAGRAVEHAK